MPSIQLRPENIPDYSNPCGLLAYCPAARCTATSTPADRRPAKPVVPAILPCMSASSRAGGMATTYVGRMGRTAMQAESSVRRWVRWVPAACEYRGAQLEASQTSSHTEISWPACYKLMGEHICYPAAQHCGSNKRLSGMQGCCSLQ